MIAEAQTQIEARPVRYTIDVTHEDIKNGHPGCEQHCAIALAVRRKLGDQLWVTVTDAGEIATADGRRFVPSEPCLFSVVEFIEQFDDGWLPESFEFDIVDLESMWVTG